MPYDREKEIKTRNAVLGAPGPQPRGPAKPTSYLKQGKGGYDTDDLRTILSTKPTSGALTHPGTMATARNARKDIEAGRVTTKAKPPQKKNQARMVQVKNPYE